MGDNTPDPFKPIFCKLGILSKYNKQLPHGPFRLDLNEEEEKERLPAVAVVDELMFRWARLTLRSDCEHHCDSIAVGVL